MARRLHSLGVPVSCTCRFRVAFAIACSCHSFLLPQVQLKIVYESSHGFLHMPIGAALRADSRCLRCSSPLVSTVLPVIVSFSRRSPSARLQMGRATSEAPSRFIPRAHSATRRLQTSRQPASSRPSQASSHPPSSHPQRLPAADVTSLQRITLRVCDAS